VCILTDTAIKLYSLRVMLNNKEAVEESAMEIIIRNNRCQILCLNYAGVGKNKKCFPDTV
jgi:hypothetical protein